MTVDGGGTWAPAELEPEVDRWAWRRWTFTWDAETPGRYVVSARATDSTGRTQPADQPWNRGGFAITTLQQVDVLVVDRVS